jgi:hypothetical protein
MKNPFKACLELKNYIDLLLPHRHTRLHKAFQASCRRHLVFCKEPLLEDIQDYKVSLYSMYCKCKLVQF